MLKPKSPLLGDFPSFPVKHIFLFLKFQSRNERKVVNMTRTGKNKFVSGCDGQIYYDDKELVAGNKECL